MDEQSKKWIEVAYELIRDPSLKIKCPECNLGILQVKDEEIKEWNKIDRYLICNNCGKWNVITTDRDNVRKGADN